MTTTTGWLIELGKGAEMKYMYMDDGLIEWTKDHQLAMRFARRQDAEQFVGDWSLDVRIVEHEWLDRDDGTATQEGG